MNHAFGWRELDESEQRVGLPLAPPILAVFNSVMNYLPMILARRTYSFSLREAFCFNINFPRGVEERANSRTIVIPKEKLV